MKRGWLIAGVAGVLLAGAGEIAARVAERSGRMDDRGSVTRTTAESRRSDVTPDAPVPAEIPVALLIDLSSHQVLFAREAGRRFMPASVAKVMTAYTAFALIGEGKIAPTTRIQISEELEKEWSGEGSSMFLKAGERPTVGQLILGSTTVSGNDATMALALATTGSLERWSALMNAHAAGLGMDESHFASANGFPDGGRTFTTAHDLAILAEAIITRHPALYRDYFGRRTFKWRGITQANHDPISGRVEGADGLKTGYTNEAGYTFLGSAERNGRRLVMVLAGAPSSQVRNKAARELVEWGFARFETRPLFASGALVGEAEVQDGTAASVMLRAPADIATTYRAGRPREPNVSIRYRGPLATPIEEGEKVASLRIETPGFAPVEVPLEAAEPVAKAGPLRRLVNGLAGLAD